MIRVRKKAGLLPTRKAKGLPAGSWIAPPNHRSEGTISAAEAL
jgi:hypothetical protein